MKFYFYLWRNQLELALKKCTVCDDIVFDQPINIELVKGLLITDRTCVKSSVWLIDWLVLIVVSAEYIIKAKYINISKKKYLVENWRHCIVK